MQTQQTQRKAFGSGVSRRAAPSIAVASVVKTTSTKTAIKRKSSTGGYVSAISLPQNPFSFNISVFKIVIVVAATAISLYLYMVVSIVVATVERKSLEDSVREEATELTYRETEYSKLVGSITLASARASGYIDANNSGFATRVETPTLTLNNE
jgi:hypothetical protein